MLVLRLVERVPPLFVRELLLRLVVPLRAVEPDGRFVLEPLPLRVLVVRLAPVRVLVVRLAPVRALVVRLPPLRVDVFRVVPLRERADEPVPLDVVRLREEVEPPVFRPVVEPVRLPPLLVVLRLLVLRPDVERELVVLRFVVPPLRDAVVLRVVGFRVPLFCAVERFEVDELRVFAAPLVFRPVVLVRANALRLLSV